jgi:hypothetical protein
VKIESVLHNHCNAHCTLEQNSPQRFDALSDLRVENDTTDSSGTWSWRNPGAGRSRSARGRGPGAGGGGGGGAGGGGGGALGGGGGSWWVGRSREVSQTACVAPELRTRAECHLVAKKEGGVVKIEECVAKIWKTVAKSANLLAKKKCII